ncbi:SMI1/KNR4 family protein [Orbaceae bacterium ESL0721]|nr:SMI1/KNR4 family protein [Orbaceae bacterium ESL0721]
MLLIFSFDNSNVAEKIALFEETLGIKIPDAYRDFLKKYNGGYTLDTGFDINGEESDIRYFYGFEEQDEYCDFPQLMQDDSFTSAIENGYLPIAEDSFGNSIVIGISELNYGEIYFYDHEIDSYHYLCPNFKDFILQIESEEYIPRSIEERIQGMKERNNEDRISDSLIKLWQAEIDKYANLKQKKVEL